MTIALQLGLVSEHIVCDFVYMMPISANSAAILIPETDLVQIDANLSWLKQLVGSVASVLKQTTLHKCRSKGTTRQLLSKS